LHLFSAVVKQAFLLRPKRCPPKAMPIAPSLAVRPPFDSVCALRRYATQ